LDPVLEISSVFQHVDGRCALDDVSLRVDRGDWLLLVGPNGAGKSLLTRLILRLDRPSAGTIRLFGQDVAGLNDRAMLRLRRDLGAVLQGGSLLDGMTVLENLLLPLRATALTRNEMARAARLVMTQLQLDGLENHRPRSLSLGQRRRVELARALIHRPSLLIWDGLTDGLDPAGAREVIAVLREQREARKLTLLAMDNHPDAGLAADDRVALMDRGRLLFDGTPPELDAAARERLDLRYLLRGRP
jgi:ABC-type multidrug transport system ATPase subunit